MKEWIKKHKIWSSLIVIFLLILLINLFSGEDEKTSQTTTTKEEINEQKEITFSKSINDSTEDCISAQSSDPIACNKAVDIISANINQKNGVATINIELAGDVPSSKSELKVGELVTETYEYQIWVEIDNKWENMLFGDITDTLGISGGCGVSYFMDANINTFKDNYCEDSQVAFTIDGNKIKIVGPLKSEISKFRIKTLYQPSSLEEDNIIDEVESN